MAAAAGGERAGRIERAYSKRQKRLRPRRQSVKPILKEVIRDQVTVTSAVIEPESLRWFVLRIKPQKECTIVRVFDLIGIPAGIPSIPKERVRRGTLLKWRTPLAPGYVLVGFPGAGPIPWREVLKFEIVRSVIMDNERQPIQVPWRSTYEEDGAIKRGGVEALLPDIDAIRTTAAKHVRIYNTEGTYRVEDGPFVGFEGKLQEVPEDDNGDAGILLNILGRKTLVRIEVKQLLKVA